MMKIHHIFVCSTRYDPNSQSKSCQYVNIHLQLLSGSLPINSSESKDVTLSEAAFLREFARLHKFEADLGKEIEIFYVNVATDQRK